MGVLRYSSGNGDIVNQRAPREHAGDHHDRRLPGNRLMEMEVDGRLMMCIDRAVSI